MHNCRKDSEGVWSQNSEKPFSQCRREDTVIIGDRMDIDIIAGLEAEIETILVLSGVTAHDDLKRFAYRPHHILDSIKDLPNGS